MKLMVALVLAMISFDAWADPTRGFALVAQNGTHVGFVLGSPDFDGGSGDCAFYVLERPRLPHSSKPGKRTRLEIAISKIRYNVDGVHKWEKKDGSFIVRDDTHTILTISASGEIADAGGSVLGHTEDMLSFPEEPWTRH